MKRFTPLFLITIGSFGLSMIAKFLADAYLNEYVPIIGEWAARYTAKELDERVNAASVVCAPVYSVADVFEDPHLRFREFLRDLMPPLVTAGLAALAVGAYMITNAYSPGFVDIASGQLNAAGKTLYGLGVTAGLIALMSGLGYFYGYLRTGGP